MDKPPIGNPCARGEHLWRRDCERCVVCDVTRFQFVDNSGLLEVRVCVTGPMAKGCADA